MQTLKVDLVSDLTNTQLKIVPELTWGQLSRRLHELTGIEVADMKIVIDGKQEQPVFLKEVMQTVIGNISSIEVIDTNENSLVSQIKNDLDKCQHNNESLFQYSEEDYERRSDSVLEWKKRNHLGRFDPAFQQKIQTHLHLLSNQIGQRCSVSTDENSSRLERRGWLRYVGKVPETNSSEIWCGVEFDEPVGKNNGSLNGTLYFGPIKQNYGSFVRPFHVQVGPQFTPIVEDELLSSDDEL